MSSAPPPVLAALERLATAFGDVPWVQGAGGNASVKDAGTLWVKASGKRFGDTHHPGGHVGVPVELVRRALDDASLEHELFSFQPRPSMETWFHALPFDVVCHLHPLDVALVACSDHPAPTLDGVPVVDLPYVRPGKGLALAMRDALPAGASEVVYLLRNHGLVVAAGSVSRVIQIALEFTGKCRQSVIIDREGGPFVAYWLTLPVHVVEARHARVLPTRTLHPGRRRRDLFPDAVVYGESWPVENATPEALATQLAFHPSKVTAPRLLEDDRGHRILVARDPVELARATEIAAAHEWLETVLTPGGHARFLDPSEPAALLALPSERFRQSVARTSP